MAGPPPRPSRKHAELAENALVGDATEANPSLPVVQESLHHVKSSKSFGSGEGIHGIIPEDREGIVEDEAPEVRGIPPTGQSVSSRSAEPYEPLPWSQCFDEEADVTIPESSSVFHVYKAGSQGPVVMCLHGGGYSGLSYALAAQRMKDSVRVVAVDLRGHGSSRTANDADLSSDTLCTDVIDLIKAMYGSDPPAIVLVGHSMGGAIAVRTAARLALPSLAGVVVVDVVEGTAMASLAHMRGLLDSRPASFPSVHKAIEWSVRGGSLRNPESARLSVPSTVRLDPASNRYVWRTPLEDSETCWEGWYQGLSELFLSCPVPKLLLLAGTDRLDRPLTIAQMQGKFQMLVIRHSGHAIQEDEPDEFASAVLTFIGRNRIGANGVEIPGLRRPIHLRSAN